MRTVLVTGGAGFIGSHLVDNLIQAGDRVVSLDDLSGGYKDNVNKNAIFVKASITDKKKIDQLFEKYKFDCVYHLAAYAAEGLSHFIRKFNYENNLIGSVNLINAAIKHNVDKFVFTSSMAVYGTNTPPFDESMPRKPEDPYGVAKAAVERDLEIAHDMWGLKYVIIRPHNVYGERQNIADSYRNVIGIFMNRIMHGKPPMIYGDGEQTRAFSYIADVAPCIARAGTTDAANGQIINLGAAEYCTINRLAEIVLKVMGSDMQPEHGQERFEVKHAYCTTEKSEKLLGYRTTVTLEEGIRRMAEWAKNKGPMKPITWKSYEVYRNIPKFWLDIVKKKE